MAVIGRPPKLEKTVQISVRIPEGLAEWLRTRAHDEHIGAGELLADILRGAARRHAKMEKLMSEEPTPPDFGPTPAFEWPVVEEEESLDERIKRIVRQELKKHQPK